MLSDNKSIQSYISSLGYANELHFYLISIDGIRDIELVHGLDTAKSLLNTLQQYFQNLFDAAHCSLYKNSLVIISNETLNETLKAHIHRFSAPLANQTHSFVLNIGYARETISNSLNINDLYECANAALYLSEFLDDGGLYPYSDSIKNEARTRLEQRIALMQALKSDELHIYLQPKVDITTNTRIGYEALLRWHHPQEGIVSPEQFIPTAEQNRLLMRLDLYVMRRVIQLINDNPTFEKTISINVSPSTLSSPLFLSELKNELTQSAVNRDLLELEVTENTRLLANDIAQNLNELNKLGIRIGVDDFGTGYSSLSYLLSLPFNIIKLDKFFVEHIVDNSESRALLNGILSTLSSLDKNVLVEGVETVEQLDILKKMGVQYAQGFYFGRPQLAEEVIA